MVLIQDLFQLFIYDAPFKIRNIIYLMEVGSYSDAGVLFRTFVETYIAYKYFILRKDGTGLSDYFGVNKTKKGKKRIKDIFESVIPNFYDDMYSELCMSTHGNPIIQGMFRGNVSKEVPLKTDINNINIDWFSYVSNQLLPLILGVINLYKYVYPNNTIETKKCNKDKIDLIYKFINNDMEERKIKYPNQRQMIEYYEKIIKI